MSFGFMLKLANGNILYGNAISVNNFNEQIIQAKNAYSCEVIDIKPDVNSETFKWVEEISKTLE